MTKQEAEQLIQERGFRIWAILGDREFQAMDEGGINLFVDWEQEESCGAINQEKYRMRT